MTSTTSTWRDFVSVPIEDVQILSLTKVLHFAFGISRPDTTTRALAFLDIESMEETSFF